ncbi:stage II sporulation protein M [Alteribacillus sp. HJP-4]|uniref:stage II sporulation protein M n=1 Tax=Alteribacillus sp. HJP-4 TaxID=2775394 RepID=UPI0035CD318A
MLHTLSLHVRRHVKEQQSLYWFTFVLLMMGVFFGAVLVNSLPLGIKNDLHRYVQQFLTQFEKGSFVTSAQIFKQSLSHHAGYIGLMWVLGLSVAGVPFILILLFLKGVVSGFTIGFLVQQMGSKGFFLAVASILPQNIVVIPCYMIMSAVSIGISLSIIKHLFKQNRSSYIPAVLTRSLMAACFVLVMLASASLFEGYISPIFIRLVIGE